MSYLEDQGFKAGDTIVCVATRDTSLYKVGDEFTLVGIEGLTHFKDSERNIFSGDLGEWKLKEDYTKDQWYPFTGTLPEVYTYGCMMADGSYREFKSGSGVTPNMANTVAFRVLQNLKPEPVVTKEYMNLYEHGTGTTFDSLEKLGDSRLSSALGIITITKEDGIIVNTSFKESSQNVT